jgi:Cu(I)/Ag(I) efflux system protein CusF
LKSLVTTLALACTLAAPAAAQQKAEDHSVHHPAVAASAAVLTQGEIRKVDMSTKKLTIRHREIKNLDMPPMTMVFQVRDGKWLESLKAGDKIRFAVEKADSGYVVTEIRPMP